MPVNEENPVIRFEPNREYVWSRDWDFSIVNDVTVNNYGFVSDFDYEPEATDRLLAVVGDSYVEAAMVPFPQTCAGRLAAELNERARVYAFGVSGSALSQYLAVAQYARDTFRPDALAVVIIENDYDESLVKYVRVAGLHQSVEHGDGRLVLERSDFEVGLFRRLLRASALVRYLVGNLDVNGRVSQLLRRSGLVSVRPAGGMQAGVGRAGPEPARVTDSKRVVDAFLDRLPEAAGLDASRIVFVVDGMRKQLYRDDQLERETGSYRDVMRRYFLSEADRRGYETADLQPAMVAHYRAHREPFEWPQEFHWNALGHEMCFEAMARSAVVSGGFPAPAEPAGGEVHGVPSPGD